ncbi:MarR family winged helix-turn-helix transcriptional regulator [Pendulispora rubella]|uniref:MarR family winged helix-turn-helix transcriptional regulator n=1 Tax=Pendulispora rubella TaxID=2741070 RepID=A0ABZ2L5V4_9BACT
MSRPVSKKSDPALADVERGMVRLRRSMANRTLGKLAVRELGLDVDLGTMAVIDVVHEGADDPDGEITVGLVAERLGVDPSRASRMVATAIEAGYVERVASQSDGRRITLRLTESGHDFEDTMRRFRQAQFARAMADWSDREREQFGRLLLKFTSSWRETMRGAK